MRSEPRPSDPLLFRPRPRLGWRMLRWCCEHVLLVVIGIPFLVIAGCTITLTVNASFDQRAALERARAIPQAEREKILRACAEIARQIEPDQYERIFGENSMNPPIPPEFAALEPLRVNMRKEDAHFKLHYFFDSGVSLSMDGLDTATPSAVLWWGEMGEEEPWAALRTAP